VILPDGFTSTDIEDVTLSPHDITSRNLSIRASTMDHDMHEFIVAIRSIYDSNLTFNLTLYVNVTSEERAFLMNLAGDLQDIGPIATSIGMLDIGDDLLNIREYALILADKFDDEIVKKNIAERIEELAEDIIDAGIYPGLGEELQSCSYNITIHSDDDLLNDFREFKDILLRLKERLNDILLHGVQITIQPKYAIFYAGTQKLYQITLTNLADYENTVNLSIWGINQSWINFTNNITLDPGEQFSFEFRAFVPPLTEAAVYDFSVNATPMYHPNITLRAKGKIIVCEIPPPVSPSELKAVIENGTSWLMANQNQTSDGWLPENMTEKHYDILDPTGLIIYAMLTNDIPISNASVQAAIDYLINTSRADGSFSYRPLDADIFANNSIAYSTATALLALSAINDPRYDNIILKATNYLIEQQLNETEGYNQSDPEYGTWLDPVDWMPTRFTIYSSIYPLIALAAVGVDKNHTVWNNSITFFERHLKPDGMFDFPYWDEASIESATAACVLGLMLAGVPWNDTRIQAAIGFLTHHQIREWFAYESIASNGFVDLDEAYEDTQYGEPIYPQQSSVTYASNIIYCDQDMDVEIRTGTFGGIKVWLNGELVLSNRPRRDAAPDQDRTMVHLNEGWNRLLVKLEKVEYDDLGFYLRFTDKNGEPITNLEITYSHYGGSGSETATPNDEGFIQNWLIVGPFSNYNGTGFETDYLSQLYGNESCAESLIGDFIWHMPNFDVETFTIGSYGSSKYLFLYLITRIMENTRALSPWYNSVIRYLVDSQVTNGSWESYGSPEIIGRYKFEGTWETSTVEALIALKLFPEITVQIDPECIYTPANRTVDFEIKLMNTIKTDSFALNVIGLPEEWGKLEQDVVLLEDETETIVNLTVNIPADTELYGLLNFSVYAISISEPDIIRSDNATLWIAPALGVNLSLEPEIAIASSGSFARFNLTVINTGSEEDTFNISISNLPDDWSYVISASNVTVGSAKSAIVHLNILQPYDTNAAPGVYYFNIKVQSLEAMKYGLEVVNEIQGGVNLNPHGVHVTFTPNSTTILPGETTTFNVNIENVGEIQDSYNLSVFGFPSELNEQKIFLKPGETGILTLTTMGLSYLLNKTYQIGLLAQSENISSAWSLGHADIIVKAKEDVNLSVAPALLHINASEANYFGITINNTGNVKTTYQLASETDPNVDCVFEQEKFTIPEHMSAYLTLSVNSLEMGEYNITVTVRSITNDSILQNCTVQLSVFRENVLPVSEAGPSLMSDTLEKIIFNGSESYDPDGFIINWTWTFGDGSIGYGEISEHTYQKSGEFEVTLIVRDDRNGTSSNTTTVFVINRPPVAKLETGPIDEILTKDTITFNGSGSYDPDGFITNWSWTFGDGTTDYGEISEHAYQKSGEFEVTLIVWDDRNGTSFDTTTIVVINRPPVAKMETVPIERILTKDTITFNGSGSYDPDGFITNWSWTFGDGATDYGEISEHIYQKSGEFEVLLIVRDDRNGTSANTTTIFIINRPPVAKMETGPIEKILTKDTITFDGSGSNDPDGVITNWSWDFGNGGKSYGKVVNHTYTDAGTYIVNLTVMDNDGAEGSVELTIIVHEPDKSDTNWFLIILLIIILAIIGIVSRSFYIKKKKKRNNEKQEEKITEVES